MRLTDNTTSWAYFNQKTAESLILSLVQNKTLFQFRSWQQAAQLQTELSKLVIQATRSEFKPRLLCGLDMAYMGDHGFASAVLWDLDGFKVTAKANSIGRVHVGYIPGFLGFREGPLLLSAARKLQSDPDVFLVDGHGRSHPRRFGLACHIGLALNRSTIGVAKSHFYGQIDNENITGPGGELLGKIVTASNGRNHYVSVGHLIQLEAASQLVEDCMVNNHPAPLREAHLEADRIRRLG